VGAVQDGAEQAVRALREGNERFRSEHAEHPHVDHATRTGLVGGQKPFAAVLSCADSRVPPEIVFDQGLGDLFTVRTAGQVLDEAVLGTLSFGVAELGIGVVVVLGHASCGAVAATLDALDAGTRPDGHVGALVDAIGPAVGADGDRGARVAAGVDANVLRVVDALRADAETAGAEIVGARYDLDTCSVTWL
jgi:carbonic anhydrase